MPNISVQTDKPEITSDALKRTQSRTWDMSGDVWDSGSWDEDVGIQTPTLFVQTDKIVISVKI